MVEQQQQQLPCPCAFFFRVPELKVAEVRNQFVSELIGPQFCHRRSCAAPFHAWLKATGASWGHAHTRAPPAGPFVRHLEHTPWRRLHSPLYYSTHYTSNAVTRTGVSVQLIVRGRKLLSECAARARQMRSSYHRVCSVGALHLQLISVLSSNFSSFAKSSSHFFDSMRC